MMGSLDTYYHRLYQGPPFKPGEEYQYEVLRLASFDKWPVWALKRPGDLADNGFYYCGHSDTVRCYACEGQISNWAVTDQVQQEHAKRYPNCPFVKGTASNLKLGASSTALSSPGATASAGKDVYGSGEPLMESLEDIRDSGLIRSENQMARSTQQKETMRDVSDMLEQLHSLPTVTSLSQSRIPQSQGTRPMQPNQPQVITEVDLNLVKYENYRLRTFEGRWPENSYVSPHDLAKAGFYYRGTGDNVQCAFCKGRLLNWKPTDSPMSEHRRHYPNCSFVLGADTTNVRAESEENSRADIPTPEVKKAVSSSERLGIMMDKPKHPEYAIESTRVDTFKTWPKRSVITPAELAKAGFFYVGYSDNVKCFFCDGGLRNWAQGDDPWREHTRWFSKCGFLKLNLSEEYIEDVLKTPDNTGATETHSHNLAPPPPPVLREPVDKRVLRARLDTPLIRTILDMGFSRELVSKVIEERHRTAGDDFPTSEALLQALINENDEQKEEAQAAEPAEPAKTGLSRRKKKNRNRKKKKKLQQSGGDETQERSASSPEHDLEDEEDEEPNDPILDPNLTDDEELRALVRQYSRIKEERTCKICMDAECSIVFLPCGHLVCCSSCAPALRTCPICRTFIKGSVRIFTT